MPGGSDTDMIDDDKLSNNLLPNDANDSQDKLSYETYVETRKNYEQKYFEQGCSLDKQFLWLAGACIGLPMAYIGQKDISLSSYHLFIVLVIAWLFLLCSVFFVLQGMLTGNEAYNHGINFLDSEQSNNCEMGAYKEKFKAFQKRSKEYAQWAKIFLLIGDRL